jgi:hypothetical protein
MYTSILCRPHDYQGYSLSKQLAHSFSVRSFRWITAAVVRARDDVVDIAGGFTLNEGSTECSVKRERHEDCSPHPRLMKLGEHVNRAYYYLSCQFPRLASGMKKLWNRRSHFVDFGKRRSRPTPEGHDCSGLLCFVSFNFIHKHLNHTTYSCQGGYHLGTSIGNRSRAAFTSVPLQIFRGEC